MSGDQWYTNKELFEQIMGLQSDLKDLRSDLGETRKIIQKYNGLREEVYSIEREFGEIKAKSSGKSVVAQGIREWGGWIVAILALIVSILKLF